MTAIRRSQSALERRLVAAASLAAVLGSLPAYAPTAAADPLSSEWIRGFNNDVRLVAGKSGLETDSKVLAGFELKMPAGWKTYWRTPGEAGGVPPEFDWSGSENLASARVLYPAPRRLTDKSGSVIGYLERVLFPIEVTAIDAAKPIALRVKAAYGVCKDLCVPAEAEIALAIAADADPSSEIGDALALVPTPNPKVGKDPTIAHFALETGAGKPRLVFEVADAAPAALDAFVEAPDGAYLPLPKAIASKGSTARFELDLSDVDLKSLAGKALTVTLVGAKGQSEIAIPLK
ncbi:MAG: protein-disulfide reductase DsbD domain-containing protein [Hyphomicrobium sp.]